MAYNCDRIITLDGRHTLKIKVSRTSVRMLNQAAFEGPVDGCFVDELLETGPDPETSYYYLPQDLDWCGEGSGSSWDEFLELLRHTEGSGRFATVWEGGDAIDGLVVEDGVVSEKTLELRIL